jgi:ABC-type transporter Mla MlaB component
MLRVTIKNADLTEIWELEGRLSGEWVRELERCWSERPASTGAALQVHLKAVSFVDAAGKRLLTEMHGRGVKIEGCGCVTRAVVEEIVGLSGSN